MLTAMQARRAIFEEEAAVRAGGGANRYGQQVGRALSGFTRADGLLSISKCSQECVLALTVWSSANRRFAPSQESSSTKRKAVCATTRTARTIGECLSRNKAE